MKTEQKSGRLAETWTRHTAASAALGQPGYLRYIAALWRTTAAGDLIDACRSWLRRARLIRLAWRLARLLILLLETGTALLLLLPLLLALSLGTLVMALGGLLELWRVRRRMTAQMAGRTVLFWCAPLSALSSSAPPASPPSRLLAEWTAHPQDLTVIVRSPHLFSSRGLGGRGFYFARRREAANVYVARTFAIFALRRTAQRVATRVLWIT